MYHKLHPEATSVEWSPIPTQIRNFVSAGQAAEDQRHAWPCLRGFGLGRSLTGIHWDGMTGIAGIT